MISIRSVAAPMGAGGRLLDCDVDAEGRLACLRQVEGAAIVTADGKLLAPLPEEASALVSSVRWLPDGAVLVGPVKHAGDDPADTCAILSERGCQAAPFGAPHQVFIGTRSIFATYSERVLLLAREASHEDDIVTAYSSATKARVLGLRDLLTGSRDEPDCYEVTSGCAARDGTLSFVGLGSLHLWTFDPASRSFQAVLPRQSIGSPEAVEALSTDGSRVWLMFVDDDRLSLRQVSRETGRTLSEERLAADEVRAVIGRFSAPLPAGGFRLDASVRGLDGGRFLLRSEGRLAIVAV